MTINCLQCSEQIDDKTDHCLNCGWTYKIQSPQDIELNPESTPVCISCCQQINELDHYCSNCGSVIGKYTEYLPFEGIRFRCSMYEKLWKRIWRQSPSSLPKKLFYLLIILVLEPIFIIFTLIEIIKKMIKKN